MRRYLTFLTCLAATATVLLASTTPYTQAFGAAHGWTYTQLSCSGGATCTSNSNVTTEGNPANSVSVTTAGKSKTQTGFWSKSYTLAAIGVPPGESVTAISLMKFDMKAAGISTTTCLNTSNGGVDVFDSANTTNCMSGLGGSGTATAAWSTRDDTQSRTWSGACPGASTNTITVRLNVSVNSAGGTSPSCTMFYDNLTMTITAALPPAGVRRRTVVVR